MSSLYLDSSAVIKLLIIMAERETDGPAAISPAWRERTSSALTAVEVSRAVLRAGGGLGGN